MGIEWTWAILAGGWAIVLGGAGGALTKLDGWYRGLAKPSWQPPDWLFGPAWTVILGLAGWSFYLALTGAAEAGARWLIAGLFAINSLAHLAWSPLFFMLRRPDWALREVTLLWLSILALIFGVAPHSPLAPYLLLPYISWVSFATLLNREIVRLNAPFGKPARAG